MKEGGNLEGRCPKERTCGPNVSKAETECHTRRAARTGYEKPSAVLPASLLTEQLVLRKKTGQGSFSPINSREHSNRGIRGTGRLACVSGKTGQVNVSWGERTQLKRIPRKIAWTSPDIKVLEEGTTILSRRRGQRQGTYQALTRQKRERIW